MVENDKRASFARAPKNLKKIALFRGARRLKTTRDGKYYIAITLGVGLVGILTANNLLYILLGMLLALIIVSGILSEASLRHVKVERKLPQRAQVERTHLVEIRVRNEKKRLPSYALEIEDLRAGQPADKRCFFLKVGPQSSQVATYRRTPKARGLDQYAAFRVATRFPFGLFEKSRRIVAEDEMVIYPAVDQIKLARVQAGNALDGGESLSRGQGDEFFGLRLRREGDDPRNIYWKRSTAGGPEVVVERSREVRQDQRFFLDNLLKTNLPGERQAFEKRVREVASRSMAHLRRGERITIESSTGAQVVSSLASGADPLLRFLALIELQAAHEPQEIRLAQNGEPKIMPQGSQQSLFTAPVHLSKKVELGSSLKAQATQQTEAPLPPKWESDS